MALKAKQKAAAVVTIFDAASMSPIGRRHVAKWLRRQSEFLANHSGEMSSRYTARYLYK